MQHSNLPGEWPRSMTVLVQKLSLTCSKKGRTTHTGSWARMARRTGNECGLTTQRKSRLLRFLYSPPWFAHRTSVNAPGSHT
eukprot:3912491-Pyramimonas_sp.AAC.1